MTSTAAVYARKSTSQAAVSDDAKSTARQVERGIAYATARGWTVDPEYVYTDDAVSGAEFERRPALMRLLNALKPSPPFQVLVMSEESRLGREQIEVGYLLKQLAQAGVRVFLYLENRERVLDSPTDKLLMSVTAFADELERERARHRTRDSLDRKARAGHVTGGLVFGYDNNVVTTPGPDGQPRRSHVERVVNDAEAATVVHIFQMAASGHGVRAIAIRLNDTGAPAPTPRRAGRSQSWAPSSVHEILRRELYRGVIIWGRTSKRDRWGQRRELHHAEREWVRVEAPQLRIVTEELWTAAQTRIRASRTTYLAHTGGVPHGRPVASRASRYLLPGIASCAACRGGLIVRSRASSAGRRFAYACHYHHARGASVCGNRLLAPMEGTDRAVLEALETEILDPRVVKRALEKAAALMAEPLQDRADRQRMLVDRLAALTAEVERFTAAIGAGGGDVLAIVKALRQREEERARVEAELSALLSAGDMTAFDTQDFGRTLIETIEDWRGLLTRQITQGRNALRALLDGRIAFTPDAARGRYEFEGRVVVGRLIRGVVDVGTFNSVGGPNGIRTRV